MLAVHDLLPGSGEVFGAARLKDCKQPILLAIPVGAAFCTIGHIIPMIGSKIRE
jgi:hypothetical protein